MKVYVYIFALIILLVSCEKENLEVNQATGKPQTIEFRALPGKDYSSYPVNYFVNIKLKLSRREWSGMDVAIWDSIIRKVPARSVQPLSAFHKIWNVNQTTGIISAIYTVEYFYNDDPLFWAISGSKQLDQDTSHLVNILW